MATASPGTPRRAAGSYLRWRQHDGCAHDGRRQALHFPGWPRVAMLLACLVVGWSACARAGPEGTQLDSYSFAPYKQLMGNHPGTAGTTKTDSPKHSPWAKWLVLGLLLTCGAVDWTYMAAAATCARAGVQAAAVSTAGKQTTARGAARAGKGACLSSVKKDLNPRTKRTSNKKSKRKEVPENLPRFMCTGLDPHTYFYRHNLPAGHPPFLDLGLPDDQQPAEIHWPGPGYNHMQHGAEDPRTWANSPPYQGQPVFIIGSNWGNPIPVIMAVAILEGVDTELAGLVDINVNGQQERSVWGPTYPPQPYQYPDATQWYTPKLGNIHILPEDHPLRHPENYCPNAQAISGFIAMTRRTAAITRVMSRGGPDGFVQSGACQAMIYAAWEVLNAP